MLSSYRSAKESVLLVTLHNYGNGAGVKTRSKIQEDAEISRGVMFHRKICPNNGSVVHKMWGPAREEWGGCEKPV